MMDTDSGTVTFDERPVIRLREWGTDQVWHLSEPSAEGWSIGQSERCRIQIAGRHVAKMHAIVSYRQGTWWIQALAGTRVLLDGAPCEEFPIMSGVEIGLGHVTLVAECHRAATLRGYLRRILGWGEDRAVATEYAQRAIRSALLHRSSIVLIGDADLVPVAQALHRYVCGNDAPFVVSDRRRRNGTAGGAVRGPANVSAIGEAYRRAQGGSLCVRAKRLPIDARFIESICTPDSDVHLFVLLADSHRSSAAGLVGPFPICVPPLQLRQQELQRIIEEYIADAIAHLEAPADCLDEDDRLWLAQRCAGSLHEIEQAALRLIALKTSRTIHGAGLRLGMASVSLMRWLWRRSPLPDLEHIRTGPIRARTAALTAARIARKAGAA